MKMPFFSRALLAAGTVFMPLSLWATDGAVPYDPAPIRATVRAPQDLLPFIPMAVGFVPAKYLFTGGYAMKLSITELRIDHMASRSRCPVKRRNCTLSLSYDQPIGNEMGLGQFDLPLLGATHIRSRWSRASIGDYVVHLSNRYAPSSSMKLLAHARF